MRSIRLTSLIFGWFLLTGVIKAQFSSPPAPSQSQSGNWDETTSTAPPTQDPPGSKRVDACLRCNFTRDQLLCSQFAGTRECVTFISTGTAPGLLRQQGRAHGFSSRLFEEFLLERNC